MRGLDDRINTFHVGQLWESPRGVVYHVDSVSRGGKAKLASIDADTRRRVCRDWDAVVGWVLLSDSHQTGANNE